jgi:hypothetical protein
MTTDQGDPPENGPQPSGRLTGILVVEVIAALIALVEPVTPSKTGSKWSPAEIFTTDPSYLQKVLAAFVAVNLLFAVLGVVVWVVHRLRRPD